MRKNNADTRDQGEIHRARGRRYLAIAGFAATFTVIPTFMIMFAAAGYAVGISPVLGVCVGFLLGAFALLSIGHVMRALQLVISMQAMLLAVIAHQGRFAATQREGADRYEDPEGPE